MVPSRVAFVRRRVATAVSVLLGLATAPGCVIQDTVTVVHVSDPRQTRVRSVASGSPEILPAGDAPREAIVARGVVSTGEQTSASYELYAARNPDGSVGLRWETHLPLAYGERLTVLSAHGKLRFSDTSARGVLPGDPVHGDAFQLPLCAMLSGGTTENGTVEYDSSVRPWKRCGAMPGDVSVPFLLETGARNVEVRERKTPDRLTAGLLIGLDALIVLPIAIPFRMVGNSLQNDASRDGNSPAAADLQSEGKTFTAVSNVLLVAGGIAALFCLPTLFAPSHDKVVYPPQE